MPAERVLILGGTVDARALASLLSRDARFEAVSSLAGRTRAPMMPEGKVRIGGFGGAQGLADYVRAERIALIADATHPFAAQISAHAHEAAAACGIPYVRLERPAWHPDAGDDWRQVPSVVAAARALEPDAHALVTVGRQELAPFAERTDVTILARMIEPPQPTPPGVTILLARPPFSLEEERALIAAHGITVLVTKNAGGEATRAKLDAARDAGLPVIIVERPAKPDAPTAPDAEALHRLILDTLSD